MSLLGNKDHKLVQDQVVKAEFHLWIQMRKTFCIVSRLTEFLKNHQLELVTLLLLLPSLMKDLINKLNQITNLLKVWEQEQ